MTNENKILWHYTTMSGLKGIVENGNIHATNIRYLNDSQEFDFGLDYLKKAILSNDIDSLVEYIPLTEDMSLIDHLIICLLTKHRMPYGYVLHTGIKQTQW